ncbi:MAG: YbaN family protein [Paludibacteraceae bacterium]|nr:YbaN family protein [Paludibacteraceae bacterium]
MKKIYTILGLVTLSLGIVGVFLPLLPTTPFILLSAFLFARGSQRLNRWLLNHRVFGKMIHDYQEEKSIPLHAKIYAISLLWISISYATFFVATEKLWLQILLVSIATAVTTHILSFKTKK